MRRKGVTKVELVTIIAMVLIPGGVVLMAVSESRETSRRTETNNNLKTCALAVHEFHDTFRRLPDAYFTGGAFAEKPVSIWFQLLPYVKQSEAYKAERIDAIVAAYIAPLDHSTANYEGTISFAANIRVFAYDTLTPAKVNPVETTVEVPQGVLKSNLTLPRIVDGTTNVVMLTTRYANCNGQRTWYASDAYGKCSLGELPAAGFGAFMGAGMYSTPPTPTGPITAMFQMQPTVAECLADVSVFGHSFRTSGMSIAMCDASVKNISPLMTPLTFSKAVSPGDDPWRESGWSDN